MTEQLDAQGEAREALSTMVTDYSKRILSDPRMLGNVVTDLLPDLPRERRLLVTAAESDVAGELTRHVEEHHLDPDTAVQLVARSLTDRTALDPAASTWVTTEYAQALGYHVRSDASPPPPPPPPFPPPPEAEHTVTSYNPYAGQNTAPPPPPPGYPGGYPGSAQPPGYPPPQGPPPGQPPAGPSQPGPLPWQPPVQSPPTKRHRWPIFAAAGTAVVVIAAVAAFAGGVFNSPKPKPTPSPTPTLTHPPSQLATPSPAPSPTQTGGVASLAELLPADIDDPATQCTAAQPKFTPVGLVKSYDCSDPGLPNGAVDAYQMNSHANYLKTWAAFNKWWGFTGYTPGSACPPPGSNHVTSEGTTTWYDKYFPQRQGQVLECEWTGSGNNPNDPSYAWTVPTENAFFIAWGGDKTSFSSLQTWWTNNVVPLASPTPVPPSP
jgi:hypothetical protein